MYLAPSAFEAGFTSIAHGETELKLTLDAAERAFAELKKADFPGNNCPGLAFICQVGKAFVRSSRFIP